MTEMTVAEAIEELKPVWVSSRSGQDYLEVVISIEHGKQIAALIEQQAQEIAKRDRMIEKACKRLSMTNMSIRTEKQWLAWLEKEAEEVE